MKRQQQGFGLVEIMVAIVLALLLTLGLVTMLVSSQQGYAIGRASHRLSDGGQRVVQLMQNLLLQSGYVNYQRRILSTGLPVATDWLAGQGIKGDDALAGSGFLAGSDRLTVRYFGASVADSDPKQPTDTTGDGRMTDCRGNSVSREQLVVLQLYVNSSGQLICADNVDTAPVVMAEHIQSFQLRYLTSAAGATFQPASAISGSAWKNVIAVEFAMLAAYPSGQQVPAQSRQWQLLDQTVNTPADRLMRQVLAGSVSLRNRDTNE